MTTQVVNLRRDSYDVYIGRAGHGKDGYFGNPFRRRVLELRGKRLGCFCKPLACHGDVLAAWIDAQEAP